MQEDIYCDKIIPGTIHVNKIFETDRVMAFYHTQPYWEHHAVIIPKKHINSLSNLSIDDTPLNTEMLAAIIYVTSLFESLYGGCRISSNIGDYQTSKHLHWYVHHGKRLK